jgi:hypothetical protein
VAAGINVIEEPMVPFVFAAILTVPFAGQPTPRGSLSDRVIRVYQQGSHTKGLVLELQRAVSRLLEGSGIALAFIDCEGQPDCNEWLRPDELVLRVMDGLHPTDSRTCGMALHGTPRKPGVLMSVYRGCVASTSKRLRQLALNRKASTVLLDLTEADMLAPIVIHEVVHLLLPGEAHGESGIWKAALNSDDWEHVGQGQLKLSAALRTRLRAAFSARAARAGDP